MKQNIGAFPGSLIKWPDGRSGLQYLKPELSALGWFLPSAAADLPWDDSCRLGWELRGLGITGVLQPERRNSVRCSCC